MNTIRNLLIALLWTLPIADSANAGPHKTVRDWSVYCENSLSCVASTYPDVKGLGSFGFSRGPQASSPVRLELYAHSKFKPESPLVFSVPGELESYSFQVPEYGSKDSTLRIENKELVAKLLPALLSGNSLVLRFETEEGTAEVKVSLSGVTGAALFMDEAQQRLGNKDALVNKGDGTPKDATSRVIDLKTSSALPAAVSSLWQDGADSCGVTHDDADLLAQYGGFRVDLSEDSSLFILPCGYPGAYNYPYVSYGHDAKEKRARQLVYPTIGSKGPTVMEHAYNVDWDDGTSQLHAFAKGRGIGDCGLINIWQFTGDGYFGRYELIEERRKDNCDGENTEFPLVWPQQ